MATAHAILPLTAERIAAAVQLHNVYLSQWRAADEALEQVRRSFRTDFSYPANLVRVATINTLYGTNVRATHRMAAHISGILPMGANFLDPTDLVEAIAELPPIDDEVPRRHRSFASKFCHFFVDADDFPVFDQAARDAMRLHLAPDMLRGVESSYAVFCSALERLRQAHNIEAGLRDLDRYLWVAGMYLAFARGRRDINRDLLKLFERNPRPTELSILIED